MVNLTRRDVVRGLGLLAGGSVLAPSLAQAASQEPPNILLLLTDDQRWDTMSCAGHPVIKTPHLDRLAAQGLRFRNSFVTTSICQSSRASIITGQYMRRHGIVRTQGLTRDQAAQSYPVLTREAGYYTGFVGKYGFGNPRSVAAASEDFDFWGGTAGHDNYWHAASCPYVIAEGGTRNVCTCLKEGQRRIEKESLNEPLHLTTEITPAKVRRFLDTRDASRPFILSASLKAAHAPWADWDPRFADLYEDDTLPTPATATVEEANRLPEFLRQSHSGFRWPTFDDPLREIRRRAGNYYRLIAGIDFAVGEIREALKERQLADNTVIIFAADNGYLLGEHGLLSKWLMHEESIRVPMIIYDPRLPSTSGGRVSDEMVLNIDLAPTLLTLAGAEIPERMQGASMVPLLHDPNMPFRDDWFYEHHYRVDAHPIERTEGVRTRSFKYIRYIDQDPHYEQLFDMNDTEVEVNNLVNASEHKETLEHLRGRWQHYARSLV